MSGGLKQSQESKKLQKQMSTLVNFNVIKPSVSGKWYLSKLGSCPSKRLGGRVPILLDNYISKEWLLGHGESHS